MNKFADDCGTAIELAQSGRQELRQWCINHPEERIPESILMRSESILSPPECVLRDT